MKRITLFIALIASISAYSQSEDAGAWMFFALEKDLPDKFTTGIDIETRLNENFSEARSIFAEIYLAKEWSKPFSTTLTYRAAARRSEDNSYSDRDRLALDFKYKLKVNDLGIQYRFRTQRQLGILGSEGELKEEIGLRHKIKFGYSLSKKWKVGIAGEAFYSWQRSTMITHTDLRLKTNATYKIKKRNYLNLAYVVQREYNTTNPLKEYNLVLGYTLLIK